MRTGNLNTYDVTDKNKIYKITPKFLFNNQIEMKYLKCKKTCFSLSYPLQEK